MFRELERQYTKKLKIILQSNKFYFILIISTFLYLGIRIIIFPSASNLNENISIIIGEIISYKKTEETIEIELESQKETVIAYFKTENDLPSNFMIGATIKLKGNLQAPEKNTIPNTFSYNKYLWSKEIYYIFWVDELEVLKEGNIWCQLKQTIRKFCDSNTNSSYLKRIILGIKENTIEEIEKSYQINGITHIFVISGMHLSIIYNLVLKVSKKICSKEKHQYIIAFIILTLYYNLLTPSISSRRAYFFWGLETFNKLFKLDISSKKIFWLNLSLNLLISPQIIVQTAFQYSFLLSFAFLYFGSKRKNKILNIIENSLIAFLFSIPITASNSFVINPLSIICNFLLVPFITTFLFPILILNFFIPPLEPIATFIIKIVEESSLFFSNTNISFIFPKISPFLFLIYYSLLILFLFKHQKSILILLFLFVSIWCLSPKFDSSGYFIFLDVGQGDSSLIISPYQKYVILSDTGKEDEVLKDNLIVYLKSRGIKKIDILLLSHGDLDHMGNAEYIVNNFKVEKVIFNKDEYNDLELELIKVLEEKNIPYYQNIKELNIDDNNFHFLNNKKYDNENDNSNVVYTEFNGIKLLLMGDASVEVEEDILKKYNLKDIDILKVGHHGSKTSSGKEFIEKINPKYSIISVGKNNRYGHPNDGVLDNLSKSKIYRTDQAGSIMFKIKNDKLEINTCTP